MVECLVEKGLAMQSEENPPVWLGKQVEAKYILTQQGRWLYEELSKLDEDFEKIFLQRVKPKRKGRLDKL